MKLVLVGVGLALGLAAAKGVTASSVLLAMGILLIVAFLAGRQSKGQAAVAQAVAVAVAEARSVSKSEARAQVAVLIHQQLANGGGVPVLRDGVPAGAFDALAGMKGLEIDDMHRNQDLQLYRSGQSEGAEVLFEPVLRQAAGEANE